MEEDKSASREAATARTQEAERQAKVRGGTERINQIFADSFTDDTFTGRRDAYTDYALPQVRDQYEDALKNLTFSLARGGNLDSSVRAQKEANLSKENEAALRTVGQNAIAQETGARTDVEATRADLIKMLNATGDVEGVTNDALGRARTMTQPAPFSPVGQLFVNASGAAAQQAAEERAAAASGGAYKPKYNTGLFANSNSVKVT